MDEQNAVGTLYIVATPIGNSRDITERAREILTTADIIAAEDTRRSVVLLNKLGIRGNALSANHKFNEYGKARYFVEQLQQGKNVAVITDAGTPCISDPGNELIRAAVEAGNVECRHGVREEVGDVLFMTAQVAQSHGVDPEAALHAACDKFARRFRGVEKGAGGTPFSALSQEELLALWSAAKQTES